MRRAALALLIALCLPPSARSQTSTAPQAIPFQFVQERQIVFPVVLNGKPAEAWLDSGAGATILDATYARSLGVALGEPIQARGIAGSVPDVHLAVVDLKAGGLTLLALRVVVMDLSAVARVTQRPVQVLLGRDAFELGVVDVDFEARRISITPREGFAWPAGQPVVLTPSADLRSVPITVGGVAMPAIFDLGNSGGLLLDSEYADHEKLFAGRRLSTELGVGADGSLEETQTSVGSVTLGGVSFNDVPTVATPGLTSRAPANVGVQLLSRFHLTIDFAGNRMWMAPYPDAATRPFRKNRVGLMLTPDGAGGLVVDHVAKGSPAERAGWKKGDRVEALDGQPIPPDYAASDASLWVFGPAGRTVTLTDGAGRQKKLTLADYY